MVKTAWSTDKVIAALDREAGRIHDSADFLSATERETFVRLLEMAAWIMHDRAHDLVPSLSDDEIQPLRDWMEIVGNRRREYCRFGPQFPSFNHRTKTEIQRVGKVIGITRVYDFARPANPVVEG